MSTGTTTKDDKTTITFSKTANTDIVSGKLNKAAKNLFLKGFGDHGTLETPRDFADQSEVERLAILDEHITNVILNLAAQQVADEADNDKFAAVAAEREIVFDG